METIDDRFEYPGTTAWTHKVQIFSRHSEFATPREFDRTQVWTNRRHRKLVTIPPLSPPYGFGIVWRSSQTQNELKICIGIGFCKLAGGGGRFSTNPSAALDSNFVEDFVGNGKNRMIYRCGGTHVYSRITSVSNGRNGSQFAAIRAVSSYEMRPGLCLKNTTKECHL
jgi:hypothetical protein